MTDQISRLESEQRVRAPIQPPISNISGLGDDPDTNCMFLALLAMLDSGSTHETTIADGIKQLQTADDISEQYRKLLSSINLLDNPPDPVNDPQEFATWNEKNKQIQMEQTEIQLQMQHMAQISKTLMAGVNSYLQGYTSLIGQIKSLLDAKKQTGDSLNSMLR